MREKHWSFASHTHPDRGLNLQPRQVPWLDLNQRHFAFRNNAQPTEPHQSGLILCLPGGSWDPHRLNWLGENAVRRMYTLRQTLQTMRSVLTFFPREQHPTWTAVSSYQPETLGRLKKLSSPNTPLTYPDILVRYKANWLRCYTRTSNTLCHFIFTHASGQMGPSLCYNDKFWLLFFLFKMGTPPLCHLPISPA